MVFNFNNKFPPTGQFPVHFFYKVYDIRLSSSAPVGAVPMTDTSNLNNTASERIAHSPPLFLLRRLADIFERHSTSLCILFLDDFSQACDSIGHSHLESTGSLPSCLQAL